MSTLKKLCKQYFGTTDIYEVLGVQRTATEKEIKKAYHNLSLLLHPDRVEENCKNLATEKFKVLGKIHAILQNKEKRKCYDDWFDIDDENGSDFNWRASVKFVEGYEKNYFGSKTELRHIKTAYVSGRANLDTIIEMLPFSNRDSKSRIIKIVKTRLEDGDFAKYSAFFNGLKRQKLRRKLRFSSLQRNVARFTTDVSHKSNTHEENKHKK